MLIFLLTLIFAVLIVAQACAHEKFMFRHRKQEQLSNLSCYLLSDVWHVEFDTLESSKVRRRSFSLLSLNINIVLSLLLVHLFFTAFRFFASIFLNIFDSWSILFTPLRARIATHTHHICIHFQHVSVEFNFFTTISISREAELHLFFHHWRRKLDQIRLSVYKTLLFFFYTFSNILVSRTSSLSSSFLLVLSQLAVIVVAFYWALTLIVLRIDVIKTKTSTQWTWRSHCLNQSNIYLMFFFRFLSTASSTYNRRETLESNLMTYSA